MICATFSPSFSPFLFHYFSFFCAMSALFHQPPHVQSVCSLIVKRKRSSVGSSHSEFVKPH